MDSVAEAAAVETTADGDFRSATNFADDAAQKEANAGVQYFFTWNVNKFVLWDHGPRS